MCHFCLTIPSSCLCNNVWRFTRNARKWMGLSRYGTIMATRWRLVQWWGENRPPGCRSGNNCSISVIFGTCSIFGFIWILPSRPGYELQYWKTKSKYQCKTQICILLFIDQYMSILGNGTWGTKRTNRLPVRRWLWQWMWGRVCYNRCLWYCLNQCVMRVIVDSFALNGTNFWHFYIIIMSGYIPWQFFFT